MNWNFSPTILFLAFSLATHAQTSIKLEGCISYFVPSSHADDPSWKILSNRIEISDTYFDKDLERQKDGSVKVYGDSDAIAHGTFRYIYDTHDGAHDLFQVTANFPAIKAARKIEFFDKAGNKFFEDTFDQVPMYVPTITKTSENSFALSNPSDKLYSTDGGKTWKRVHNYDYKTNSFSLSDSIASGPDFVILICSIDPNPPHAPGVALWAPNPSDYVFEFADDEEPTAPTSPAVATSNNNTQKSFLSRIFGK
ncbi:MAG: hypothetical protein FWG02_11850 [Holophagaceae bacterium]|nr:hypothetical protein [Holophagaceae bacterium]